MTISPDFEQHTAAEQEVMDVTSFPVSYTEHLNQIVIDVREVANKLEVTESSQRLQQISSALQNFKVKVGFMGSTSSGKSTTVNALLGQNFLATAEQKESVCPVCIQHEPNPGSVGNLFGREKTDYSLDLLASGAESILDCISKLNREDHKTGTTKYAELVLRAPILCLAANELTNYEVYDTPGVSEGKDSVATAQAKYTLESSAAIVLVISPSSAGLKYLTEFIDQIREAHPSFIEEQNRMLILINKYDKCFPADKNTWDPETFKNKIVKQTSVPAKQIVCFSAECALKARLWKLDLSIVDECLHISSYAYLHNTPVGKDIGHLREYTPENVKRLVDVYERFSRIHEVEDKLCEALFSSSLIVLLKSSVGDTCCEIDKLKSYVLIKIEKLQEEMDKILHLIEQINEFINYHCRNTIFSSLDIVLQDYRENLKTNASSLREKIQDEYQRVESSLNKQYDTEEELQTGVFSARNEIIRFTNEEIKKLWDGSIQQIKSELKLKLGSLLSKLKQDDHFPDHESLNFESVSPDRLLESLSFPPAKQPEFINEEDLDTLILPLNVPRQRSETRKEIILGWPRFLFFGPRHKFTKHSTVLVDYTATVYELNVDSLRQAFETFASDCADFITYELDTKEQMNELSKMFLKELQNVSEVSKKELTDSLNSKLELQKVFEEEIKLLDGKRQELHRALSPLLPKQSVDRVLTSSGAMLKVPASHTQSSTSKSTLYQGQLGCVLKISFGYIFF